MTVNSKKICLNHLKIIYTSGAIADETLIRNAQKAFPETEILNVYGLSEAGPRVSAQRKGNKNNRIGSVGLPINRVDIKIILNNGSEAKPMEKGVIHIQTPCRFSKYVFQVLPDSSLFSDWYNTGDVGYMDEVQNLYITGRADNMIIIGSHNVYPEQIESKINKITGIRDCVIIPEKHDIYGQRMLCYYVADNDMSKELSTYCMRNLASYETPYRFMQIRTIPTNNNGKKVRKIDSYIYSYGET